MLASGTIIAFFRHVRGTTAVIFALSLIPLTFASGGALDFARAQVIRSQLQMAADAGALNAAKERVRNRGMAHGLLRNAALDYLKTNFGKPDARLLDVSVRPLDTDAVEVTASAEVDTFFLKLFGMETMTVSVQAEARVQPDRINFIVLIDTSPTMTLPSETGVHAPVDGGGCFFSCHDDGSLARAAGLKPKMDVIREMLTEFVDFVERDPVFRQIDVTYTVINFNLDTWIPSANGRELKLESDTRVVRQFLSIPLVLGGQGTNLVAPLRRAQRLLIDEDVEGTNIVLMISDGVHERAPEVYTDAFCRSLPDRGASIFTLHIENGIWAYKNPNARVGGIPFLDWATPHFWEKVEEGGYDGRYFTGTNRSQDLMRACASDPSWAYSGEFGTEIRDAFRHMFQDLKSVNLRLSR